MHYSPVKQRLLSAFRSLLPVALIWGTSASAEEFTLRFSHVIASRSDITSKAALLFQKEVETESRGRIKVQLFFGSQLGSQSAMTDQVKDGTIQMVTVGFPFLSKYVPDVQAVLLPFLFTDEDDAHAAFDGPLGDDIRDTVLRRSGIRILAVGEFGFSDFFSRKGPVETVSDMKGLKVRVTPNSVAISTFSAFGAIPVTMDLAEIYTGIQRGAIDGADIPMQNVLALKFYEVGKFFTVTHHFYQPMLFNINDRFFKSLPEDLQAVVQHAAISARDYNREAILAEKAEWVAELKQKKVSVAQLTPQSLDQFRKSVEPIYTSAQEKFSLGPDGMRWLAALTAKR